MKFAIVENGKVVNIAESLLPLTAEWYEIDNGVPVNVGDTHDGYAFYDPDGNMRMSYIQTISKKIVDQLGLDVDVLENDGTLKSAQIQALSDRNDFLEDCIAEMAGIIYA